MSTIGPGFARLWTQVSLRWLPFADAASTDLPLARLLRLSLFQISVGMAAALLLGTLNRVMIVELGMAAWLVAAFIALPILVAPLRALVGHRSDTHRSLLGWRRVPYLWMGSLLQFGGLATLPFALILLSGDRQGPAWVGHAGACFSFLLLGLGMQTVQTAGLALATDLSTAKTRPRVVALMYVMLLVGMLGSALLFGWLLADFSALRLIQVVQGAALATMALNIAALWKQEPRQRAATDPATPQPGFLQAWRELAAGTRLQRFLVAVGLGTAAFNMQDVILEPYGAQILGIDVAGTTRLTALAAAGSLLAFGYAAARLRAGADPLRLAAHGGLAGIVAFSAVIFSAPLDSAALFRTGCLLIGFGGGLFAVSTLCAAMQFHERAGAGLLLGAWGAVQASCGGLAIGAGGSLRDLFGSLAQQGAFGPGLALPVAGYSFVYHLEILLLFLMLAALGPLVRADHVEVRRQEPLGLAELPG